jgi:tRNA(Ile)-lysidine synthase
MNVFNLIDSYVHKHRLLCTGQRIIVGLSGGPDSVFLLHYLLSKKNTYNLTIIAAHLNHEWRDSAQADADFCEQLCNRLKIPFVSAKLSELNLSLKPSGSKEQDARRARQTFFKQLITTYNADTVALAHHKNDQEETFFIRLLRGASLSGLVGMRPHNTPYIRPLLCIDKQTILSTLANTNYTFAVDPTNESSCFLRNRIRHMLIPALNTVDKRFSNSFMMTLERLQETELFLMRLTEQHFAQIAQFVPNNSAYVLNKELFLALDPILQYRLLVYWLSKEVVSFPITQAFFDEMIRFLKRTENGSHLIHPLWHLVKAKSGFYIRKITS